MLAGTLATLPTALQFDTVAPSRVVVILAAVGASVVHPETARIPVHSAALRNGDIGQASLLLDLSRSLRRALLPICEGIRK